MSKLKCSIANVDKNIFQCFIGKDLKAKDTLFSSFLTSYKMEKWLLMIKTAVPKDSHTIRVIHPVC